MMLLQILLLLFAFPGHKATPANMATIYYPGDGHCGKVRADGKPFRDTDRHFAHRTLPLGTKGFICSTVTHKCAASFVGDRGPYGTLLAVKNGPNPGAGWRIRSFKRKCFWVKEGERIPCAKYPPQSKGLTKPRVIFPHRKFYWYQVQVRLQPGWGYRGYFDLTRPVAKEIGHKSFQRVIFFYIPRVKKPRKSRDST